MTLDLLHIALERQITHLEAQADPRVRELLIPMFIEKNNNPNQKGSGIINGDPNMKLYIQSGKISLRGLQAVLLGTDGLTPQGWSVSNNLDRMAMLDEIRMSGVRQLIDVKHRSEDEDPEWKHTRYKHSDHATGLLLTV